MANERAIFRRTLEGFTPANDVAQDFLHRTKLGELVAMDARKARGLAYHRLFFAMLKLISDNSEPTITPDEALFFAKLATGTGKWLTDTKGREHFVPGSISFASMKQDDFEAFVKSAIPPLCLRFMNGTAPDEVVREAMSLAA